MIYICRSILATFNANVLLLQDLVGEAGEGKEEEALGDVVEEELAATSQAVEEAARRIQVSLSLSLSLFNNSLTHNVCIFRDF